MPDKNIKTQRSALDDRREWTPGIQFADGLFLGAAILGWAVLLAPPLLLAFGTGGALLEKVTTHSVTGSANLWRETESLLGAGGRTLAVAIVTAAVSLLLGGTAGLLLSRTDVPRRGVWMAGGLALAATPLYVITAGWVQALGLPFMTNTEFRRVFFSGAIGGLAMAPLAALLTGAALRAVPADSEEAARLLTPWPRVLARVTLPQVAWALAGVALLTAVAAAGEVTVADALWAETYASLLFQSFQLSWRTSETALVALPLLLFVLLGWMLLAPLARRFTALPLSRDLRAPASVSLGRLRPAALLFLALLAALYAGPLFALVLQAFGHGVLGGGWDDLFCTAAGSGALAAGGAALAVALAIPCAWWLRIERRRLVRRAVWAILLLLLALPAPLAGMAMIHAWNRPGLPGAVYDSPLIVILLYATRFAPAAVIVLWAAMRQIPASHIDALRLEGEPVSLILWRLVLPACRRAAAGAWALCFILSLSEVGGVVVLNPPGLSLFAIRFATQIHFGVYPELARLALIPPFLALIPAAVAAWSFRKQ